MTIVVFIFALFFYVAVLVYAMMFVGLLGMDSPSPWIQIPLGILFSGLWLWGLWEGCQAYF